MRRAKGTLAALALLTGTLALVVPAVAAAGTPPAVASTGTTACTGFQDDFATDYPGTLSPDLWAQAGPVARAVGAQLGTPLTAPVRAGLSPWGWSTNSDGFSALQSTTACGGPFTFSTIFEGDAGLEHVDISLATADLSEAVTVEGNMEGADKGIWAGSSLSPAGAPGAYDLDANPCPDVVYALTISVDASGDATVTLANYFSHKTLGTSAIIPVGLAPLYVVLGQGPGRIVWGTASVIPAPQPCSVNDDFGADPTLSPYWSSSAGAPQSVLTSVASTLDANFVAPTPNFSYTGPPGPGMFLGHINGGNEFTAVQSVDACSGPFTFSATVEGVNPRASNSFDIALVSQDLSETLSIEGVLDPSSPRYGISGWPHAHPGCRRRSRRHPLEQWHFYSRSDRRRVRLSRGHGQRLGLRLGAGPAPRVRQRLTGRY